MLEFIRDLWRDLYNYGHRICSNCGSVIPEGHGYVSMSWFSRLCDDCLPEIREAGTC